MTVGNTCSGKPPVLLKCIWFYLSLGIYVNPSEHASGKYIVSN